MKLRNITVIVLSLCGLAATAFGQTGTPAPKPKHKPAKPLTVKASLPATTSAGDHMWALLVGVSAYQSQMIAQLHSPASDVTAIASSLEDPKLGGLPASHVLVLTNEQATRDAIDGSVDTFFKPNVKPGDEVIVYLAGHGVAKGVGETAKGYLLPYDVKGLSTQALDASAVNLKDLMNNLAQLPAAKFVAFIDACREDPTPGRGVKGNSLTDVVSNQAQINPVPDAKGKIASSVTFFACSIGQRAYEDPTYQHGVFTYWILDAIKQGDVAQTDGSIDMGVLGSYVTGKVSDWAKNQSASGDFEVDQTPQLVTADLPQPLVLMTVKRTVDGEPMAAAPPMLSIAAPDNATVTVNGKEVGQGDVEDSLPSGGEADVTVSAPGYAPVDKKIDALPGYIEEVPINPPPASRGLTSAMDPSAAPITVPDMYTRAQTADKQGQWEAAESGYTMTIQTSPDFAPAYQSLAELERKQGRYGEWVGTLIDMNGVITPTAQSLAEMSYGLSQFALKGPGASTGTDNGGTKNKDYHYPKSQQDAGSEAIKAAHAAVAMNGQDPEAQRDLGFAEVATDNKGKNKKAAQLAFGDAEITDENDPVNHYAMGYGIQYYAQLIKDDDARNSELQRAVTELKQAITARPNYYEAHLELAYCYHQMGDRKDAENEYTVAGSYRGEATDGNEVAGVNCALGALYTEDADNTTDPAKKQDYQSASKGEWADARDQEPDLKQAMTYLRNAGLSTQIVDYLPPSLQNIIDWKDTMGGMVQNGIGNITSHIHLPF